VTGENPQPISAAPLVGGRRTTFGQGTSEPIGTLFPSAIGDINMAKDAPKLDVRYPEDLEYCYRDIFKAFVGEGEVLLEFANINRSKPEELTVTDRIVISIPNAVRLVGHLQAELAKAKERFDKQQATKSA
jgi:hypothetical protein